MSNIDKEGIIVIIISVLITALFVLCIKCYYKHTDNNYKTNNFGAISQSLNNTNIMNQEKARLI